MKILTENDKLAIGIRMRTLGGFPSPVFDIGDTIYFCGMRPMKRQDGSVDSVILTIERSIIETEEDRKDASIDWLFGRVYETYDRAYGRCCRAIKELSGGLKLYGERIGDSRQAELLVDIGDVIYYAPFLHRDNFDEDDREPLWFGVKTAVIETLGDRLRFTADILEKKAFKTQEEALKEAKRKNKFLGEFLRGKENDEG